MDDGLIFLFDFLLLADVPLVPPGDFIMTMNSFSLGCGRGKVLIFPLISSAMAGMCEK